MEEDVLYKLEDMDGMFEGFQLDSILAEGGIEYKILLNENVKEDLEEGRITLNAIECSLLNIPDSVFKSIGKEEFLIDCKETKTRLVLSKVDRTLEILIAKRAEDLPIY